MSKTLTITWAYEYGSLTLYDYDDNLEDAVSLADFMEQDNRASLDCIEVWDENGYRCLNAAECRALNQQFQAAKPPSETVEKPIIAELWVTHPSGKDVCWSGYRDMKSVHETVETLDVIRDRVRVVEK